MSESQSEAVDVGVKQARGLETDNFLSKVKEMIQATVIDPQVAELKQALQNANKENDNLSQQLTKAKMQCDAAEEKVKDLKNEKLLKMAKSCGDHTLTEFLMLDTTDTEAVAGLQHSLNHILTTMNNTNTLDDFLNEHQLDGEKKQ
eukprot:2359862-Rhodomonas_salina.1